MFDDMDSKALLGSEVFRNLMRIEAQKEAEAANNLEKSVLQDFQELQLRVNASPILRKEFRKLQEQFINDPDSRSKVNQDFVQGVLLLRLED